MRNVAILLTAAVCASLAAQPAMASDKRYGRINPKDQPTEFLKETALIPIKMVAVPTALVFGTPVSIIRSEARAVDSYATALSNEYNSNESLTPLMLVSLPGQTLRLVGAVGQGLWNSSLNAAEGWREPFSAKSFSLEEDESL